MGFVAFVQPYAKRMLSAIPLDEAAVRIQVWANANGATAPGTTPWWATPLVAGVFALIGVGIAQCISIRLDRRRRREEQARRLDAAVREAITAYLADLWRLTQAIVGLTRNKSYEEWPRQQLVDLMLTLTVASLARVFVLPERILRLLGVADRAALVLLAEANEGKVQSRTALKRFETTIDSLYAEIVKEAREYFGLAPLDPDSVDTGEEYRRLAPPAAESPAPPSPS